jgi:hypothetical protein
MRRTWGEAGGIILKRILFPTSAMAASPEPLQFEQRDNSKVSAPDMRGTPNTPGKD